MRKHLALDYDGLPYDYAKWVKHNPTLVGASPESKLCVSCEEDKDRSEFGRARGRIDGRKSYCKECARKGHAAWADQNKKKLAEYARCYRLNNPDYGLRIDLRRAYGLELEDYKKLLDQQDGTCAICKGTCSRNPRLSVDHCHETGQVRGLLCNDCNLGLGKFRDDRDLLLTAAAYLGGAAHAQS
jgi:hypothetical protein